MVVISGNPLISVGQSARLQSAFKALDFIVLVDIYPNATSEVAITFCRPPICSSSDINLAGLGLQHDPFVQYTAPIVSPRDERRPEWQIMGMLERALAGEPFQEITDDPLARMRHMLRRSDIDLQDLEEDVMPVRFAPSSLGNFRTHYPDRRSVSGLFPTQWRTHGHGWPCCLKRVK